MFKFNKSRYPNSYGWLTKKQQNEIIGWFENEDFLMKAAEEDKNNIECSDDISALCGSFENHYRNRIQAAKSVLSITDIYVEHGWTGHEGKYFLATYDDAKAHGRELEDRYQEEIKDDSQ